MATINEEIKRTKSLSDKVSQKLNLKGEVLGLHESVTKLWTSLYVDKDNEDEIGRRLSSVLIGTLVVANRVGINNLEYHLQKRIGELEKYNNLD